MQYLGADITLPQLAYLKALSASFLLDVQSTNQDNITDAKYALMYDKAQMINEIGAMIAEDSLTVSKNGGMYALINSNLGKAMTIWATVQQWSTTAKQEPNFQPAPYSPGVPFASPPALPSGIALTYKTTFTPLTAIADRTAGGRSYVPGATTAPAKSNTGMLVALAGAAAVAFLALR
jgi:hypothetical protein